MQMFRSGNLELQNWKKRCKNKIPAKLEARRGFLTPVIARYVVAIVYHKRGKNAMEIGGKWIFLITQLTLNLIASL
jgi:hypothetical protein